jgi:hypothetical protein
VVDNPDDRWREVAARLVADTELFELRFDRAFFGGLGPSSRSVPTCSKPAG